jgi:NAD+ kinase
MIKIGILYHPARSDSSRFAEEVELLLRGRGIEAWKGSADEETALCQAARDLDALVTLGGDGTIVAATRAVAVLGVPILGVNLGRLGFLAEIEPAQISVAIPWLLEGRYSVEERMMLHADLYRGERCLLSVEAINDAVVARGSGSRTVRIWMAITS